MRIADAFGRHRGRRGGLENGAGHAARATGAQEAPKVADTAGEQGGARRRSCTMAAWLAAKLHAGALGASEPHCHAAAEGLDDQAGQLVAGSAHGFEVGVGETVDRDER